MALQTCRNGENKTLCHMVLIFKERLNSLFFNSSMWTKIWKLRFEETKKLTSDKALSMARHASKERKR